VHRSSLPSTKIIVGTLAAFSARKHTVSTGAEARCWWNGYNHCRYYHHGWYHGYYRHGHRYRKTSRKKSAPSQGRIESVAVFLGLVTHLVFSDTGIAARLSVDAVRFVAFGGGLVA
jgi:hypothetical protein